jgi:glycosyltransferase involved in cell wall biosynthesis
MPLVEGSLPVISILIIAGTGRPFLYSAIKSLVDQSEQNWEAIIVEACESDLDSRHVYEQIAKFSDPRIRSVAYSGNRAFPPHAAEKWNFASSLARGRFLAFLDDDDMKGDGWLHAMCEPLVDNYDLAATLSHGLNIDNAGNVTGSLFGSPSLDYKTLVAPNFVTTGQVVIRHSIFDAMGGFDKNLVCAEDWEFYLRLSNYPWVVVPGVFCLKRDSVGNSCYHMNIVEFTQEALRRIIRVHSLAPEVCHGCKKSFDNEQPFVRAVPGLGFRFWHHAGDCVSTFFSEVKI